MRGARALAACALLAFAACGDRAERPDDGRGAAGNAASDTVPDAAPAVVPDSGPRLALEGEGLRVFDAATGSARPLPFGIADSMARQTVERVLGAPPVEEGENADCAIRYATWADGLSLTLRDDRFVGWSLRGDSSALTTPTGVGIGSTLADIESAHTVEVTASSLGTELNFGGMAGLLESGAPDARVIALWAGEVCLAR